MVEGERKNDGKKENNKNKVSRQKKNAEREQLGKILKTNIRKKYTVHQDYTGVRSPYIKWNVHLPFRCAKPDNFASREF